MSEEQKITNIELSGLTEKVKGLFLDGYRLVQIGCTKLESGFELNYSFDKDYKFINLRLSLADFEKEIPSISGIYWAAFLYENETADLFGARFKDIAVDYKGTFYNTQISHPFNVADKPQAPEAK